MTAVAPISDISINLDFPEKALFLFDPHPYKVMYGGRDSVKSWSAAQALLLLGMKRRLRILCARETQQSIRESVHQLLQEQIARLGLGDYYEVLQYTIRQRRAGPDAPEGTEFIFVGLRNLSVEQLKSFESIDIVWVEEAQVVGKRSWGILLPTIRKAGSEIWVTFNPEFSTDDTYVRWVVRPPKEAVVVRMNYRDNIWLSDESRMKMEHLKATDPEEFDYVYEGVIRSTIHNAIYRAEIARAEKEGRFTVVPYEPAKPVETYWDLGYADKVAIWFAQAIGFEYRIIDYLENSFQALDWYVNEIQKRGYTLGMAVLPWDGGAKNLGTGRSIRELLVAKGFKVRVLPQMRVADGINAVRTIFHQCWFDAVKCEDGISGLRRYQWGEASEGGQEKREPLHDDASHPADAFRSLAMHIRVPEKRVKEEVPAGQVLRPPRISGPYRPYA
jgi:phage terminase large subunit